MERGSGRAAKEDPVVTQNMSLSDITILFEKEKGEQKTEHDQFASKLSKVVQGVAELKIQMAKSCSDIQYVRPPQKYTNGPKNAGNSGKMPLRNCPICGEPGHALKNCPLPVLCRTCGGNHRTLDHNNVVNVNWMGQQANAEFQ